MFSKSFRRSLAFFTVLVVSMNLGIFKESSMALIKDYSAEDFTDTITKFSDSSLAGGTQKVAYFSPRPAAAAALASKSEKVHTAFMRENITKSSSSVPSINDGNSFSACLQVMDDNHFLLEWIPFHWHMLPLRRLIVFADPNSRTSPKHVLDRWKERINITLWDNEEYVYPEEKNPTKVKKNPLRQHRNRQRQFVRQCLNTLKREGRGWVLLVDTDEYAMINERTRSEMDPLSPRVYAHEKHIPIPSPLEHGSVLKFLSHKDTKYPHTNESLWNITCLTINRKVFGTYEEPLHGRNGDDRNVFGTKEEILYGMSDDDLPLNGFQSKDFQTFHWKYYSGARVPAKSIINLHQINITDIPRAPSVHRPLDNKFCKGKMWLPESLSVIVVNHYPRNEKQMLFRANDARGQDNKGNATAYNLERFKSYKKHSKIKESYQIRQWVLGFIEAVGGESEASRLLKDVGLPHEASHLSAEVSPVMPLSELSLEPTSYIESMEATRVAYPTTAPLWRTPNAIDVLIPSKNDTDTFAGCLLIMDDNHILIEWLAYNYHVMPLRRLIVLADPHSVTTPATVLDRWRDRMNITLWKEENVFPNGIPLRRNGQKFKRVGAHRLRQKLFVRDCLQTLYRESREWVLLVDTDEYPMISDLVYNPKSELSPLNYAAGKALVIPKQQEHGSVLKFLKIKDVLIPHTGQKVHNNPCITLSRKTFGTQLMNSSYRIEGYAYNSTDFQTFNWRYYVDDGKPGKAIINLKQLNYTDISDYPSIHRPLKDGICKGTFF